MSFYSKFLQILKSFFIFVGIIKFRFPKHNLCFKKIVHFDSMFGAIEKEIVKNAFRHWSTKTNNLFIWDFRDDDFVRNDNRILVTRAFSTDLFVKKIEEESKISVVGYATFSENLKNEFILLVIDQIENTHYLWLVSVHEIGHNLLLEHNEEKSIMNSKYLYRCSGLQKYDLETVWNIWKTRN